MIVRRGWVPRDALPRDLPEPLVRAAAAGSAVCSYSATCAMRRACRSSPRERRGQERLHDRGRLVQRVLPGADARPRWRRCARGPAGRSPRSRPAPRARPGTLLAAICSPLPEPPITTPRLPGSATTRAPACRQYGRVVVLGVVGGGAHVDHLVPGAARSPTRCCFSSKPAWSDAEVDAHGSAYRSRQLGTRSASTRPPRAFGVNQVLLRGIFCRARFTATKSVHGHRRDQDGQLGPAGVHLAGRARTAGSHRRRR